MLIGTADLLGLHGASRAYEQIFTNQFPSILALGESDPSLTHARTALDEVTLYPNDRDMIQLLDRAEELIVCPDEARRKYLSLPHDGEGKCLIRNVTTKHDAASASLRDTIKALRAGGCATVDKVMEKGVSEAFRDASDLSLALGERQLTFSGVSYNESYDVYICFHLIMIAAITLVLVVVLWYAWLLLHTIIGPLSAALTQSDRIIADDLIECVRVDRQDKMDRSLEGLTRMQIVLTDTVRRVRMSSESISAAIKRIATGNTNLSQYTEE